MHPNIPQPNMGPIMKILYRARLMVIALIAPEFVISWAIRQWVAARELGKQYESEVGFLNANSKLISAIENGWTHTHGFFAMMGGFMLYEGDEPQHVILPKDLKSYVENGEIRITETEIRDRSKGDALAKGLVVIQTSWFILQCIARRVEHLPITELELVTVAFAVLNFGTYALWWNKPLNVECAVRVYKRSQVEEGKGQADADPDHRTDQSKSNDGSNVVDELLAIWRRIWHEIKEKPLWVIVLAAVLFPVSIPLYAFWQAMRPIFKLVGFEDDDIEATAKRVPTFYADSGTPSDDSLGFFAGIFTATVFGSIHCVAWSAPFPSHTEQLLWRISSLVITCAPALQNLAFGLLDLPVDLPFITITILLMIAYIMARVTLLVLPFMALRSLPLDAYQTVPWTTFIPHL